jgi:hypothetical protein
MHITCLCCACNGSRKNGKTTGETDSFGDCALGEVVGVEGGEFATEALEVVGFGGEGGEGGVDVGVVGGVGVEGELFVLVGEVDGLEQNDYVGDGGGVLRKAFGGLALDADVVDVEREEIGDALAHLAGDGDDFGLVHDEDAIDVDDFEADEGDLFECGAEEDGGVRALPFGVGWGEEGADVAGRDGAEEGVGDGVEEEVAVGVAGEAFGVVDVQTTDDERHVFLEGVGVEAEADAHAHCR